MRLVGLFAALALMIVALASCEDVTAPTGVGTASDDGSTLERGWSERATGFVEVAWRGGRGNPALDKRVFAAFTGREGDGVTPSRGLFALSIVNNIDNTRHREFLINLTGVEIQGERGWMVGEVVYDSRGCGDGNGHDGGHDGGCSGGGHDDGHDGGCGGGDDGHDDGHDGGCGDDGSGGCGGGDDGHDGGSGGNGGPGGNGQGGSQCRIGQVIGIKLRDLATPGANGDHITWRWFAPDDPDRPDINDITGWPHLCRKTILAGNLVVHTR